MNTITTRTLAQNGRGDIYEAGTQGKVKQEWNGMEEVHKIEGHGK